MAKKTKKVTRSDVKTRFTAKNQPARRGRPKSVLTEVKKGWDARLAKRMAAKGIEGDDIAELMGIEVQLRDVDFREEFNKIVRHGHSQYRARIQDLASKHASTRPTILTKELGAWSPRHRDDMPPPNEFAGAADRILALIEKAKVSLKDRKLKAKAKAKKRTGSATAG